MSVFISLGIVLAAMLIQAFLQLTPSVFTIFYHYALGKTSKKKADDQSLSFILGVEIFIAITFLITYIIIAFFIAEKDFMNSIFLWILSGIFFAEGIFILCCYFKNGKKSKSTTKLFIPRSIAKSFIFRVEHTKNRSDTIALGFITAASELLFTLPLFIISSIQIFKLSRNSGFIFIIAYIIIATLPLFAIRTAYRTDHNFAEIQRFRVKRKLFFRLILSLGFIAISILTFISGVI